MVIESDGLSNKNNKNKKKRKREGEKEKNFYNRKNSSRFAASTILRW